MIRPYDQLPGFMQKPEILSYYLQIKKKRISLILKRAFDLIVGSFLLILLSPVMLIVAILIKVDSPGPIFYRQIRVTQYGKQYRIFKFRTMVNSKGKNKQLITGKNDNRITKVGSKIRDLRIDEIPQLLNVLTGDMTFVGTRPEVLQYVEKYTPEMMATLLLPAGITSPASIKYKDETEVIQEYEKQGMEVEDIYTNIILPEKMEYNLTYLKKFSFLGDLKVMIDTVVAVLKRKE
ncbi:lipopolysaccharide/colanic/teichoic acid biosynthesis glycosyltransferase [Aequitasia blattaphilus]|uniref:Sugar transferase n=1 Tax=Aequitasia blattaphilus TaxID=2949332 RepID=A0ABT1E6D2_9FIRM|nr:sugar transferase [Aequitasia blattaphilus]MCP1101261.1 sugar transferase [Aequitasia blattaphilus]MCR8613901.1 sugar transferase [Aequitasia blattaphilus]